MPTLNKAAVDERPALIPSGTIIEFLQDAAPPGWTQIKVLEDGILARKD